MKEQDRKTIFCTACGAEFDISLPECPYCGTMNYKGAEEEYLRKLEDVREELDDLQDIPEEQTVREVKKHSIKALKWICVLGILIGCSVLYRYVRGTLEDRYYEKQALKSVQWLSEYSEEFDKLYQEKKYDEMRDLFIQSTAETGPPWDWEYTAFLRRLDWICTAEEILQEEKDTKQLSKYYYYSLFYEEWNLFYDDSNLQESMSQEQYEVIQEKREPLRKDFETRWNLTPEKMEELQKSAKENYGILDYGIMQDYVDEWLKDNEVKIEK